METTWKAGMHGSVRRTRVKVSIVVPTHNTGETVLTGLRSFLSQTMPRSDFEVIYVDDGSTDDTVDILEAEVARRNNAEPSVRVLQIENSGWPGRPRNIGTDAARGEFVHYVDDDDWLAPEALERTYARARETDADIVIGRMAGHGRKAPRALFDKPVVASDLRTDTTLLASMTVHKLFRRDFLVEHGLRFAEGEVRLEDHMFTLRAFLLTGRVATVHDYTCYHWVRHRDDDRQNISYGTIDPGPYVDSIRRVLALLDASDTYVAPGRHRYRLAANWYGKKALARLTGRRYLQQSDRRRAEWFDAVSALAAEMPPAADAALPTRLRIVAALARHGDRSLLEDFAKFEAGVDHHPRVHSSTCHFGKLTVRCSTRMVRKGGKLSPTGFLAFSREHEGYRLQLPSEIAAVPGVAAAADFTKTVQRRTVRGQLRHREGGTVLNVSTSHHVDENPPPRASARGGPRATVARLLRKSMRLTSLLPGTHRQPQRHTPRFEAELTIDPATADHGRPLAAGTWDVQLQLGCGGWRSSRKLRGLSIYVPAEGRPRSGPRMSAPMTPGFTRPRLRTPGEVDDAAPVGMHRIER
jgi:glycosyltransferase involved in cell wall biosynthesis